jgi:hypothetical protein
MTGQDDFTPHVRAWLKEPVSLRESGATEVSRAVHTTPQQRGLLPPLSGAWSSGGRSPAYAIVASVSVVLLGVLLVTSSLMRPGEPATPGTPARDWQGVEFKPVAAACADGCDWDTGGVFSVAAAHRGDFGSVQAIAFGPTGAPWFLSDNSVWQLGVPGGSIVTPRSATNDLAVTSDGVVWVAGERGLYAYDGTEWTEHWRGGPLESLDITSDDRVYAVGGGRGSDIVAVARDDDGTVTTSVVDVIDPDRFPTSIMVSNDGRIWVSAVASGYFAPAEGESLIAFSDGSDWHSARPLGADVDVAAWSLVRGPDGALWTLLASLSPDEDYRKALARLDDAAWTVQPIPVDDEHDFGALAGVGSDGTTWFLAGGGSTDEFAGVLALDGESWTRYLGDQEFGTLAIDSDGTVLVTTIPGFDEDGELLAIRRPAAEPAR